MIERTVRRGYVLFVYKSDGKGGPIDEIDAQRELKQVKLSSMDQIKGQEYKLMPVVAAIQEAPNRAKTSPDPETPREADDGRIGKKTRGRPRGSKNKTQRKTRQPKAS